MELLTGKAKEDFLNDRYLSITKDPIYKIQVTDEYFNTLSDFIQQSLIIDWLDSVQLQIMVYCFSLDKYSINILRQGRYMLNFRAYYNSRTEATTEAIKKANEIYNQHLNK